jgi:predicted small integral membrane protein
VITVQWAAVAGFALTASMLVHLTDPGLRLRALFIAQVLLIFLAGAVLRVVVAAGTPDPAIDVYSLQDQAAARVLAGTNPYTGEYGLEGALFYPPLPFLVGAVVRACGGDVRLGNAACDVVAAAALLALAWGRGDRLLGSLLAASYLHFPRVPLITQLAWYEPMIAAALGVGLLQVARRWRLGYLVLGLGISGKQYGVVFLLPLLKALRGRRLALLGGTTLAVTLVVLPFFLWDTQAFLDRVVFYLFDRTVRLDGITIPAAARNEFGVEVPKWLCGFLALLLIGLVAWRTPAQGSFAAPWMATSLLIFCLFASQAFINYYYLCQYLMLLGLAEWFSRDAEC